MYSNPGPVRDHASGRVDTAVLSNSAVRAHPDTRPVHDPNTDYIRMESAYVPSRYI